MLYRIKQRCIIFSNKIFIFQIKIEKLFQKFFKITKLLNMPTYKISECPEEILKRVHEAEVCAHKSSMMQKVGAIVVVGKETFDGCNNTERIVFDGKCTGPSSHAEMFALRKCGKKIGKRSKSCLQDAWLEKEF